MPGLSNPEPRGDSAEHFGNLNIEGWTPPTTYSFNAPMIHRLLQRRGLRTTRPIWSEMDPRQHDGEVTLQEYADRVGGDYIVVDGVPGQFVLRQGRQMATLTPGPRAARAAPPPTPLPASASAPSDATHPGTLALAHAADGRP